MQQNVDSLKKLDLPIDTDNEAIIISNAIQNAEQRRIVNRKVDYLDFRYKEYQVIAWSIKAVEDSSMDLNIDSILLKSKSCPVRYNVNFAFVQAVVDNFPVVSSSNLDEHISKLQLDKIKSELSNAFFTSIYPACLNPISDLNYLNERMKKINGILEKGFTYSQSQFKDMNTVITEWRDSKINQPGFYTTGIRQLDEELTEGLKPKGLTIICGLPSMGKSSLTLSLMNNLSNSSVFCPQFALEMDNNAIATKLASFASRIPVKIISKHYKDLNDADRKTLDFELDKLAQSKYIYLNDSPGQSLNSIKEQVMILQDKIQKEYMFVSIDLFGKIKEFLVAENFASEYEKKLNITQQMAKELGVNFGLVAQINRAVMGRKFARPKMSDLKNAGAWEEVADLILGVHRPFYDPEISLKKEIADKTSKYSTHHEEDDQFIEQDPDANLAEVIILKQRMGAKDKIVNFLFDPDTTRYTPIASEHQEAFNSMKDDYDE